jgi:hypothetical protein
MASEPGCGNKVEFTYSTARGDAVAIVWTLMTIVCLGVATTAAEPALANKPVPIPAGLDIASRLRESLKSGTPTEKEAALDMIRALKPIELIPDVIDAIEDPTALPLHVTPKCKTGWGFVSHQASTVIGEIARDIDGITIGMNPGNRAYQFYSFHNDLADGAKLKASGRLSKVRNNWSKWWDATRK